MVIICGEGTAGQQTWRNVKKINEGIKYDQIILHFSLGIESKHDLRHTNQQSSWKDSGGKETWNFSCEEKVALNQGLEAGALHCESHEDIGLSYAAKNAQSPLIKYDDFHICRGFPIAMQPGFYMDHGAKNGNFRPRRAASKRYTWWESGLPLIFLGRCTAADHCNNSVLPVQNQKHKLRGCKYQKTVHSQSTGQNPSLDVVTKQVEAA